MKLLHYPNKNLEVYCHEVKDFNVDLHNKLDEMQVIMTENNGMGLAANQVGLTDRMFIMRDLKGKLWEFINPLILVEFDVQYEDEACLSFPGISVQVKRAKQVSVEAFDRHGEKFHVVAVDKEAVCVQHEIQHLNGLNFFQGLSRQQKRDSVKRLKK
jgi:peptide deformylase